MVRLRWRSGIALIVFVLGIFSLRVDSQTTTKKPKDKSSASKALVRAKAIEDSIKVAREDSLRQAALSRSIADSLLLEHVADSLEQWRADSLKKFPLRKVHRFYTGIVIRYDVFPGKNSGIW